ncbi:MAG: Bax inhibitor-1 family protein [Solirubrobacterales bacterium]|nr:Bax inhibitor-1 family protein [Solirubrobacterales bacterium]
MPLERRTSSPGNLRYGYSGQTLTRDQTRGVFGQVMGLVAFTAAFAALGAYVGRDLSGGSAIFFFLGAFACIFGLQFATRAGREQLAIALLFGVGLLLGLAVAPVLAVYAKADPGALYQASGSTALFVGGLGAYGYATRRDLSSWVRTLFWALLALIVLGLVLTFVAIPGGNVIYSVLGLALFGAFTVFDFNRLRRASMGSAVPIAASIFLDIFNVFLFFLSLFGGGGNRR